MNPVPRISVVTPCYNQVQFIERTMQSVINQKYPNLEYIVIDGGSTDGSLDVIRKYRSYLNYFVSEPDRGQADAINKGFRMATGKIFAWLNSDDLYAPGALECVARYFTANPSTGVVVGDCDTIDINDDVIGTTRSVSVGLRTILYTRGAIAQPAAFFTHEAFQQTGELNIELFYTLDFEFFLRMRASGVRFGIIRRPLAQFRLHPASKTVSEGKTKITSAYRKVQKQYLVALGFTSFENPTFIEFIYRVRLYLARLFIRGQFIPFSSFFALRRAEAAAHKK